MRGGAVFVNYTVHTYLFFSSKDLTRQTYSDHLVLSGGRAVSLLTMQNTPVCFSVQNISPDSPILII